MRAIQRLLFATPILLLTAPTVAFAQARSSPFYAVSIGAGQGLGGQFAVRKLIFTDLTIGLAKRPRAWLGLTAAGTVGSGNRLSSNDFSCQISIGGGCVPALPTFVYAGALLGANARYKFVAVHGMIGPGAFFSSSETTVTGQTLNGRRVLQDERAATVFGTHARMDLSLFVLKHVALYGSVASRYLPNFRSNSLRINSKNFGIRFE